jgi:hypothetical protein
MKGTRLKARTTRKKRDDRYTRKKRGISCSILKVPDGRDWYAGILGGGAHSLALDRVLST